MSVIISLLAVVGCAYLFFLGASAIKYFIDLEKRVSENETDIEMLERHYRELYWKDLEDKDLTSECTDYE